MMEVVTTFAFAFFFSFIGTIPPGTLSLTIMQLGLSHKLNIAWRMALAAAIIEYPYAWIAVAFQDLLRQSINITHSFHLVSAIVMLSLGTFSFWSAARPSKLSERFEASGFRKGIVLGLLNPLAIPFWMAMTAYLKSYRLIDLSNSLELHAYLVGVSSGTLVLFMLLAYLARNMVSYFKSKSLLQKVPGILLIILGLHSLAEYIFG